MSQVLRSQTWVVPRAPHVTFYVEQHPHGEVWIHFACARCGDESMKRCENFAERGAHWASMYAMNHNH